MPSLTCCRHDHHPLVSARQVAESDDEQIPAAEVWRHIYSADMPVLVFNLSGQVLKVLKAYVCLIFYYLQPLCQRARLPAK